MGRGDGLVINIGELPSCHGRKALGNGFPKFGVLEGKQFFTAESWSHSGEISLKKSFGKKFLEFEDQLCQLYTLQIYAGIWQSKN
ncbi:MAG: hypothetical protein CM15mP53_09730 [Ectothiorhodospiraceae bacterium]|nr:MAG: hypothetical protein CM15mP53_09730 [Ectothiorhodospiraceae bacterium]